MFYLLWTQKLCMNHNNGCLRKIVVACSVRNPTDSTTKYTKNLKTVHSTGMYFVNILY